MKLNRSSWECGPLCGLWKQCWKTWICTRHFCKSLLALHWFISDWKFFVWMELHGTLVFVSYPYSNPQEIQSSGMSLILFHSVISPNSRSYLMICTLNGQYFYMITKFYYCSTRCKHYYHPRFNFVSVLLFCDLFWKINLLHVYQLCWWWCVHCINYMIFVSIL